MTIYYSSGQVNVPNVVGLDYNSAATKLTNAKLVPARVDQSSDTVPAGQVISTNPARRQPAVQGSTVTVVVSTGPAPPQPVSVPPVTGMTQADAQQALADADLKNTVSKCLATTATPDGQVVVGRSGAGHQRAAEVDGDAFRRRCDADHSLPVSDERRIRVAVLYGGRSSEHDISVMSGRSVIEALDPDRYDVVPVQIERGGAWQLEAARPLALEPGADSRSLVTRAESSPALPGAGPIDVVLPVLHGPFGEDGTVQGLLEMLGLPYVGAGVLGSALTMDKDAVKMVLRGAGIAVAESVTFRHRRWDAAAVDAIGYPCFVKPARLGSSVGISKVHGPEELDAALELAFRHDWKVLVEEFLDGREVEVGVLGNADPLVSVAGEILIANESEWYDFSAKYDDGGMRLAAPADLPDAVSADLRDTARRAFELCECAGMARIDFFVVGGDRVVLNEINTIPGFTATSVYARLFEASGIAYRELLDRLIALALERHADEQRYER